MLRSYVAILLATVAVVTTGQAIIDMGMIPASVTMLCPGSPYCTFSFRTNTFGGFTPTLTATPYNSYPSLTFCSNSPTCAPSNGGTKGTGTANPTVTLPVFSYEAGYIDVPANGSAVTYYLRVNVNAAVNMTLSVVPFYETRAPVAGPGLDILQPNTTTGAQGYVVAYVPYNKMAVFRWRCPAFVSAVSLSWTVWQNYYVNVYTSATPFMDTLNVATLSTSSSPLNILSTSPNTPCPSGVLYIAVTTPYGTGATFNFTISPAWPAGSAPNTSIPTASPWPSYQPYAISTPLAEVDVFGVVDIGTVPTTFSASISANRWQYFSFAVNTYGSWRVNLTPYPGSSIDLFCGNVAPAQVSSSSWSYRWSSQNSYYTAESITVYVADPGYIGPMETEPANTTYRYYCQAIDRSSDGAAYSVSVSYLGEVPPPAYGMAGMDLDSSTTGLLQTVGVYRFRQYRYKAPAGGTWSVTAQALYSGCYVYVSTTPFTQAIVGQSWSGNPIATIRYTDSPYLGPGGIYYIAVAPYSSSAVTFSLTITPPTGTTSDFGTPTPWPSNPAYALATLQPNADIAGTIIDLGALTPSRPLVFSSTVPSGRAHSFRFTNAAYGSFRISLQPYAGYNVDLYAGTIAPANPNAFNGNYRWSSAASYWPEERVYVWVADPFYAQNATYYCQSYAPQMDSPYTLKISMLGETVPPDYSGMAVLGVDPTIGNGSNWYLHSTGAQAFRQYVYRAPANGPITFQLDSLYGPAYLWISNSPFTQSLNGYWNYISGGQLTVAATSAYYQGCAGLYYLAVYANGGTASPATYNLSVASAPTGTACSMATATPFPTALPYAYASALPDPDSLTIIDLGGIPAISPVSYTLLSGKVRYFKFTNSQPGPGSFIVSLTSAPGGNADLYVGNTPPANPNSASFSYRWGSGNGYWVEDRVTVWSVDPYFLPNTTWYVQVVARVDTTYSLRVMQTDETAAPSYDSIMDVTAQAAAGPIVHCVGAGKMRQYRWRSPANGLWSLQTTQLWSSSYIYAGGSPVNGYISNYWWSSSNRIAPAITDGNFGGCGQAIYFEILSSYSSQGACYNLTFTLPTGSACSLATQTPMPSVLPAAFATLAPSLEGSGTIRDMGYAPAVFASSLAPTTPVHYYRFNTTQSGAFTVTVNPYPSSGGNIDLFVGTVPPANPASSSFSYRWASQQSMWGEDKVTVYTLDSSYVDAPATYWVLLTAPIFGDGGTPVPYSLRVDYLGETPAPAYGVGQDLVPETPLIHTVYPYRFRSYRYTPPVVGDFTFTLVGLYSTSCMYVSTTPYQGQIAGQSWSMCSTSTLTVRATDSAYRGIQPYYIAVQPSCWGCASTYNISVAAPAGSGAVLPNSSASATPWPSQSPVLSVSPYSEAVLAGQIIPFYTQYFPIQYAATLGANKCQYYSFDNYQQPGPSGQTGVFGFTVTLTMAAGGYADLYLGRGTAPSPASCSYSYFASSTQGYWAPESIVMDPSNGNFVQNATYYIQVRTSYLQTTYGLAIGYNYPTPSPSPSGTATATPVSWSSTPTRTATGSASASITATSSGSATSTSTASGSSSATETSSHSSSKSATSSASASTTPSNTASASTGASQSVTGTASLSGSGTASGTASVSGSPAPVSGSPVASPAAAGASASPSANGAVSSASPSASVGSGGSAGGGSSSATPSHAAAAMSPSIAASPASATASVTAPVSPSASLTPGLDAALSVLTRSLDYSVRLSGSGVSVSSVADPAIIYAFRRSLSAALGIPLSYIYVFQVQSLSTGAKVDLTPSSPGNGPDAPSPSATPLARRRELQTTTTSVDTSTAISGTDVILRARIQLPAFLSADDAKAMADRLLTTPPTVILSAFTGSDTVKTALGLQGGSGASLFAVTQPSPMPGIVGSPGAAGASATVVSGEGGWMPTAVVGSAAGAALLIGSLVGGVIVYMIVRARKRRRNARLMSGQGPAHMLGGKGAGGKGRVASGKGGAAAAGKGGKPLPRGSWIEAESLRKEASGARRASAYAFASSMGGAPGGGLRGGVGASSNRGRIGMRPSGMNVNPLADDGLGDEDDDDELMMMGPASLGGANHNPLFASGAAGAAGSRQGRGTMTQNAVHAASMGRRNTALGGGAVQSKPQQAQLSGSAAAAAAGLKSLSLDPRRPSRVTVGETPGSAAEPADDAEGSPEDDGLGRFSNPIHSAARPGRSAGVSVNKAAVEFAPTLAPGLKPDHAASGEDAAGHRPTPATANSSDSEGEEEEAASAGAAPAGSGSAAASATKRNRKRAIEASEDGSGGANDPGFTAAIGLKTGVQPLRSRRFGPGSGSGVSDGKRGPASGSMFAVASSHATTWANSEELPLELAVNPLRATAASAGAASAPAAGGTAVKSPGGAGAMPKA